MFAKITKSCLAIVLLLVQVSIAQDNAARRIAPGLIECYADPYLSIKDNLLPHTIDTLINLIRKIENAPELNQGITQLPNSLLHRFRQDGIVRNKDVSASSVVIPYSASSFQLGKHEILLKKLLPGNAVNFPNNTLNAVERCTLHSMLSSSVDTRKRGDEGQRCNQLANYRALRAPRSLKEPELHSRKNRLIDVELIDKTQGKPKSETYGKIQATPTVNSVDDYGDIYDELETEPKEHVDTIDFSTVNNNERSECPVENGVIKTIWGTISPGTVLNGITTGLQNQRVPLNILMNSRRRASQQNSILVDNRWASTLAGDLAEVVLRQVARGQSINIGGSGAWNSSVLPKWYFLSIRDKFEMTDAEIRGGIDGLIIAQKIKDWEKQASNLKLSQVLDMYYSQKGVFDTGIRACDRKKFFNELIKPEELKKQTTAFSKILSESITTVTIKEEAYSQFADIAVNELIRYIPQSLNDLSCESTAPNPNTIETDIATDLIIFIDTAWPYKDINGLIGYVLQNINLDGKTSSVTILDALGAEYISSTTLDESVAMSSWTEVEHQKHPTGLNLRNVILTLQNITMELMNYEKGNSSVGGRSLVSIIVPYTAVVDEGNSDYAWDRLQRLREDVPDIRILFFAQGSVNRFERFVVDKKNDLIPAQASSEPLTVAGPLVARLKELSRRIINHRCGSDWNNDNTGISMMKQCASPGTTKYYRIMPNYFYSDNGNRKLKIQAQQGTSTITVCTSRVMENPRANTTINKPDDLDCKKILTNAFELDLSNPCSDAYEIHSCSPYYISVEGTEDSGSGLIISDKDCKLPNDVPFTISAEQLTCHNSGERIFKSSFLIILSYFLVFWYRS